MDRHAAEMTESGWRRVCWALGTALFLFVFAHAMYYLGHADGKSGRPVDVVPITDEDVYEKARNS